MAAKTQTFVFVFLLAFLVPLGGLYLYQNKLQTEVAKQPPAPLGMAARASAFLGSNTGKGVVCAVGLSLVAAAGIWWRFSGRLPQGCLTKKDFMTKYRTNIFSSLVKSKPNRQKFYTHCDPKERGGTAFKQDRTLEEIIALEKEFAGKEWAKANTIHKGRLPDSNIPARDLNHPSTH